MSIDHDERPSLQTRGRPRSSAERSIGAAIGERPAARTSGARPTEAKHTTAPERESAAVTSAANDRSFSVPVIVVAALFVILGGFFLGIVLFPLFKQPKSLVPVIAGPASITVSGDSVSRGQSLSVTPPAHTNSAALFRFLQVGAFGNAQNAHSTTAELIRLGVSVYLVPEGDLVKVQVGPFRTAQDREAASRLLEQHGFPLVERDFYISVDDAPLPETEGAE